MILVAGGTVALKLTLGRSGRQRFWLRVAGPSTGGVGDCYDVVDPTIFEALAESGGVTVASISSHRRWRESPVHGLVDHVHSLSPLGFMADSIWDAGFGTPNRSLLSALVGRCAGIVLGLGQIQSPVDRTRCMIGGRMQGHRDLAVADLAQRSGILPGHAGRS